MSRPVPHETDIGAAAVSPLIASQACALECNITALAVTAGGDKFAAALGDGSIQLIAFDSKGTGESALRPVELLYRHEGAVTHLAMCADTLISAGQDGRVVAHGLGEGGSARVLFEAEKGWINTLAIHAESRCVAASADDSVNIIKLDGTPPSRLEGFASTVSGIAFDKAGARLAVSHYDGVSISAIESGAVELSLEWKGSHTGVTWSPDDRYVVSTTQEREVHVWDLVTLQDFRMGGYPRKVHQMDWLDGGEILACSGADVITAWSFAGSGPKHKPPLEIGYVFGGTVTAVAAHPDKKYIAGGFSTGGVMIGGVVKGEARVAKPASGSAVTALAWAPGGRTLISANEAGEVNCFTLKDDFDVR